MRIKQAVPKLIYLSFPLQIKIVNTTSLRDAFCTELVKLSPSELATLDLHGSTNLRNFVLSPSTSCPNLTTLDLSACSSLGAVLIQSSSVTNMALHNCASLKKVLLHCPNLATLALTACPQLDTVMIWSDQLTSLDLTGCNEILTLKLHCPNLVHETIPALRHIEKHVKPSHPPIASMLKVCMAESIATWCWLVIHTLSCRVAQIW